MMKRPLHEDYPEYFHTYVKLVPDGAIKDILVEQQKITEELINTITDTQANSRYAPGKWSLKEVFGHIIDTERIMSYRLLRIARGDQTPLAGFEENSYVDHAHYDQRSMSDLLEEYKSVRHASITLVNGLAEEAWDRRGIVNENPMTAGALAYVLTGHALHHLNIMKERYLA